MIFKVLKTFKILKIFKIYLQKNELNTLKAIFCDVIGFFIRLYDFILLKLKYVYPNCPQLERVIKE